MATNCAAEAGEGAGAAFLWTDEVSPDWFFNCSDRPEPHGLASVPTSRKIMTRRQRAAVKRGAEAPSGQERLRISNQVATLEMAKAAETLYLVTSFFPYSRMILGHYGLRDHGGFEQRNARPVRLQSTPREVACRESGRQTHLA
jgi:hypothetical protein